MNSIQVKLTLFNDDNKIKAKLNEEGLNGLCEQTHGIFEIFLTLAAEAANLDVSNGQLENNISWLAMKLRGLGRDVIEKKMSMLDEEIFNSPERKKDWEVHRKDDRSLKTEFGTTTFKRRYYKNKSTNTFAYLADECAGIEKGSRIEKGLMVKIAENVKDLSYQKASQTACCPEELPVSKNTVKREIRKIEPLELPLPEPGKVKTFINVLHINADEDHIAMQSSKSSIVKSVTIHERRLRLHKNKTMLKGRKIYATHKEAPEDFWYRVLDNIIEVYGDRDDLTIYIHGDGAGWIQTGVKIIKNSVFILDKFHLKQAIARVLPNKDKFPYMNFLSECKIWQYFRHGGYSGLKVFLDTLAAEGYINENAVSDVYKYLRNNKIGITNNIIIKNTDITKSCTEAQISHVLSSRLSSRPMGWSPDGVEAVVNIRTHLLNGGRISSDNFKKKQSSLEVHNEKIYSLRKKLASEQYLYNFEITQLLPKSRDNAWLRNIAKSGYLG